MHPIKESHLDGLPKYYIRLIGLKKGIARHLIQETTRLIQHERPVDLKKWIDADGCAFSKFYGAARLHPDFEVISWFKMAQLALAMRGHSEAVADCGVKAFPW
jgi:hypothetical protein